MKIITIFILLVNATKCLNLIDLMYYTWGTLTKFYLDFLYWLVLEASHFYPYISKLLHKPTTQFPKGKSLSWFHHFHLMLSHSYLSPPSSSLIKSFLLNISNNDIKILRGAYKWKILILNRMVVCIVKEITQNFTMEIIMGGFLLYERPSCNHNFNGRY